MRFNKRRVSIVIFTVIFSFVSVFDTFAEEDIPKEKQASIIEHCDTIRASLKATQRSDSHARTYLGSLYETFLNQFLTPLNVRLLKNNISNPELTEIQADLVETRNAFNSSFISYSKSLEDLINTDCINSPKVFYSKLQSTRKERAIVDSYTKKISNLISSHEKIIIKMEQSL